MDTRHFWQIARFNGREEAAFVAGGWPGAAEKGDFITFIEMFLGGGPRAETKVLIGYFRDVIRKSLYEMGITVGGGIYLYDFPVWALDNTASNSGAGINTGTRGLLAMIDLVRRHEYLYLKRSGLREMGRYVKTIGVSCQHHDSNLVAVHLSRLLRALDTSQRDPFTHAQKMSETDIRGNKKTESFAINAARFIAGCLKQDTRWGDCCKTHAGDEKGLPVVKSARFWSVQIVAGE
jgi:hypothetical protein